MPRYEIKFKDKESRFMTVFSFEKYAVEKICETNHPGYTEIIKCRSHKTIDNRLAYQCDNCQSYHFILTDGICHCCQTLEADVVLEQKENK